MIFFFRFADLILNSFKFDSNQTLKPRLDNEREIAHIYHDMRKPVHANTANWYGRPLGATLYLPRLEEDDMSVHVRP